ncbi:DUF4249 domain-containing protein [Pseudoflavitalea sp. X16]|uniref:DUF4249 domain-containing protein n=1 Tax=Paraflavitalea devenefica TaxID=2716334 RepID=UPI0014231FBE|nr:DUF4249 domain-containing protein [Paraflavitalea devenefica]NII23981.1 DUF4249 domain-containing protein [Paraflavitalea devenefica]
MKKLFYSCVVVLLVMSCKEQFDPPVTAPVNGYLVVDGIINSGTGSTNIRLSRTVNLADSARMNNERNALVRVEGEDNSSYPLAEVAQGLYSHPQLSLSRNVKYRLYIKTSDGKEYVSDYSRVIPTPPIDSIRWEQPGDLQLYINTHDPLNKTLYYRWEWEETWEFHSAFTTQLEYAYGRPGEITGIKYRFPNQNHDLSKYYCWKHGSSTNLIIGSSAKLSRDSIDLPLHFIPRGSVKLSVLYSIKVKQYAVSREGYDFLQRMKKNTEQTGTLFDAQPSELVGNIHAKNNPNEIVIGFVDVADQQEKRIFIRASEMNNWGYRTGCTELIVPNVLDSILAYSYLMPTSVEEMTPFGDILSYRGSGPTCVDCTLTGTNVRPSFWP